MATYYCFLGIISALLVLHARSRGALKYGSVALSSAVMVAFEGLRGMSVGTDTGNYERIFNNGSSGTVLFDDSLEPLFLGVQSGVISLGGDFTAFLTTCAAISLLARTWALRLFGVSPAWFWFILVAQGAYTFEFNALRQGMAVSFFMLCAAFMLKGRPAHAFAAALVAAGFHASGILSAVALLLLRTDAAADETRSRLLRKTFLALLLVSGAYVTINLAAVDKQYLTAGAGGGRVFISVALIQAAVLYILAARARQHQSGELPLIRMHLVLLLIGAAAVFLDYNPSGLLRITAYTAWVPAVVWPRALSWLRTKEEAAWWFAAVVAVNLAYFHLATTSFADLLPYVVRGQAW